MGREVKRVALDFDWPINGMIWKGYHNPYSQMKCSACDGCGLNPEMKKLSDEWYGFEDRSKQWCHNITQDEVQALVDAGRLMEFTRVPRTPEQEEIVRQKVADGGNSWLPEDNGYVPTAEEVNLWSRKGFGHDCINKTICVEARAKRLGISTDYCKYCDGHGGVFADDKYQKLQEDWEPIEPPAGEGYQLWSTTTEGTPMSPVFAAPEELAQWLTDNNASTFGYDTADYDTWLKFIRGPGWAMSAVGEAGKLQSGVDFAASTN